jgi:hypothetical protein
VLYLFNVVEGGVANVARARCDAMPSGGVSKTDLLLLHRQETYYSYDDRASTCPIPFHFIFFFLL